MIGVSHANQLVYIALGLFLPLTLIVFRLVPAPLAAISLLLAGELFLPADGGIDLPGLPVLGRDTIVYTSVLLAMILYQPRKLLAARPGIGLEWLGIALAIGGFFTALTNGDPLHYGPTSIQGIEIGEAPTAALLDVLAYVAPFVLGRVLCRDLDDLQRLFSALAVAGIVYSLFAWVEMWMSPQFHNWVYGFIPIGFDTTWRLGGYRPMVFQRNGLAYAILMATTMLAAVALARARLPIFRFPSRPLAAYLFLMVLATRSLAVMVWGALMAPLVWLMRPRIVGTVALVLSLLVISYPVLRIADVVSWQPVVDIAQQFDAERARSLGGRFEVEGQMLAKARERIWFGWGGYSRNWIFDPDTGERALIPDGHWILLLGSRGVVGYVGDFGLSVIPVAYAWRRLKRIPGRRERILVAALMLIISLRLVDLIPNGRWTSLPVFLAGALHSCSYAMTRARARQAVAEPAHEMAPASEPPPAPASPPPRLSDTLRRTPGGVGR